MVEYVQKLAYQPHEFTCLIPGTRNLLFVQQGPPAGDNGVHSWQYVLDTDSNQLHKLTTDRPTVNVRGYVARNGALYTVAAGSPSQTGYLAKIDPKSWKRTKLLNNYYEKSSANFNDLDIDLTGNFYLTDSKPGYPDSGIALEFIRVGGGEDVVIALAFEEHELCAVGRDDVWHFSGKQTTLGGM
ncbi:hypothetical protein H2203_003755 [Taxawa tesnikishii (nom. ined.)]|nr:hypothetical protein H2203_003755 [Dothideales sp. JES 119]